MGYKFSMMIVFVGKNAWTPWSIPTGEDKTTFSYDPHDKIQVDETCSVCQFKRTKRPRSLMDKIMNRNKKLGKSLYLHDS